MAAAVAIAAIELLAADGDLVARLHRRIAEFRAACAREKVNLADSMTAIQPLKVDGDARALEVSSRLRASGYLVPAIRPPTVPEGTSRLRISISAAHGEADVQGLARALADSLA